MEIQFYTSDISFHLKNRKLIKGLLREIGEKHQLNIKNISYIFSTDNYVLCLNNKYLRHNYYTDVLSFDLSHNTSEVSGEIYISIERVKENAKKFSVPFMEELMRVIIHGLLHLLGWRDKLHKQKKDMHRLQDYYLAQYVSRETKKSKP